MFNRVMLLRLRPHPRLLRTVPPLRCRHFFRFFRSKSPQNSHLDDNLFHPFSKSPHPAIRARGEAVQSLAPCPVCATSHDIFHVHTNTQPPLVRFECPDCGWPTHCSEEHWKEDEEHQKYCKRLKEANEDEHDLRSGRPLPEFDLPGACHPCPESNQYLSWRRTAGIRRSHFLCKLGCLLVHPWFSVHGH